MAVVIRKTSNRIRFNDDFQIYEYTERIARHRKLIRSGQLQKSKFLSKVAPELNVTHLEDSKRFTLKGLLKRRFNYGYWDHLIFYSSPRDVGLAAFPLKLAGFTILLLTSIFYSWSIILLIMLYFLWLGYRLRLYRSRSGFTYCLGKFKGVSRKLVVLLIIIIIVTLEASVKDLGRSLGIIDSIRRKNNKNIK